MRILCDALLHLYPQYWHHRFGDEMAALLDEHQARLSTVFDLAGGCADAWLHPEEIATVSPVESLGRAILLAACCVPPFGFALFYWAWLILGPTWAFGLHGHGLGPALETRDSAALVWAAGTVLTLLAAVALSVSRIIARRAGGTRPNQSLVSRLCRPPFLIGATDTLFVAVAVGGFSAKNGSVGPDALARLDGAVAGSGLLALLLIAVAAGVSIVGSFDRNRVTLAAPRAVRHGLGAATLLMLLAAGLAALLGFRTIVAALTSYPWLDVTLMSTPALACVLALRQAGAALTDTG